MSADRPVLLTVSGTIPADLAEQIGTGSRPRVDYLEMAEAFDADLLDHPGAVAATGRVGRLLARVAGANAALAWACFRQRTRYRVIFTDGEQVGIPLAALLWFARRRPRHVMIGHVLSTRTKSLLHRLLRLQRRVDTVLVYASTQERFAIEHLGYEPAQVVLHPFMVDTRFWQPDPTPPPAGERPTICAVGKELRDYATLAEAARGLDVDVVLATASPWSRRKDGVAELDVPANVRVGKFDMAGLRDLYARSALVVVPLQETDFQAGITTILEAMAMGRAVVCSRTTGQQDTIVDGETGVYVPPGDVAALRAAIERLLADDAERARLGANARAWVVGHADIARYATDLAALVSSPGPGGGTAGPDGPRGT